MPVYDTISAPDYNNIRLVINNVIGSGVGNSGYGQAIRNAEVFLGDFVTKTQWDLLRFDIVNCIIHQSGSLPTIKTVQEGDTIIYAAAEPNFQYLTLANQAVTNRFDIAAGQYATESKVSGSYSTTWQNSLTTSFTVTFANANDARYFFNSGSKVRFQSSYTPRISNPQNNAWTTLLNAAGTVSFGGNTPTVNFYTLTSSDQVFYNLTSTSYTSNRLEIKARCNVANNALGGATSVTFTVNYIDAYVDPDILAGRPPNFNPPDGTVQGTINLTVGQLIATGALYPDLLPNSFAITSPTYPATITITGS